jgi:glycosyltransferase involved in cell wall biosynthesis
VQLIETSAILDLSTRGEAAERRAALAVNHAATHPVRVCFVVESGTDVRMVEGMAEHFELYILARKIEGGVEINHPPTTRVETVVGPASRAAFARVVFAYLFRRSREFDHVIVQGYGLAALAANLVAAMTSVPTTMLVCSPVEAYYRCRVENSIDGKPFRRREFAALRLIARLNALIGARYIVLSRHLRDAVRGYGSRRPIEIIPIYGVDTSAFSPSIEPKNVIRARRGLPANSSLILFSSRIAPEKDHETLLTAVRLMIASGRDVWLLNRSGGYRSLLERARRAGVADRLIATDAVDPRLELPDDYRCADVCVQASREEGLGFSVLEAMACGAPVIAADVGGLRETVLEGRTGWLYPPGNAPALARTIAAVLDNPGEASRRATAAREFVRENFARDAVFGRLSEVIAQSVQTRLGRASRNSAGQSC